MSGPLGLKPFIPERLTQLFVDYSGRGMGFELTQVNEENLNKKRTFFQPTLRYWDLLLSQFELDNFLP